MSGLRYVFDAARSAAMNMAIDETLFASLSDEPVLRIYFWDKAYCTIGYFQKNDGNAVRRLTGGLSVSHCNDLSYGFCACAESWPYIYSQANTYKNIHAAIKNALSELNIECVFAARRQPDNENNGLCVQTLYRDDLLLGGKKIAGSCMRRRGKKILVQGSIHLDLKRPLKEKFASLFAQNTAAIMKCAINISRLSEAELEKAALLAEEKYSNRQWNKKF